MKNYTSAYIVRCFQNDTTVLSATWLFEDAQSGIEHFEIEAYEILEGNVTLIYPQVYVELFNTK